MSASAGKSWGFWGGAGEAVCGGNGPFFQSGRLYINFAYQRRPARQPIWRGGVLGRVEKGVELIAVPGLHLTEWQTRCKSGTGRRKKGFRPQSVRNSSPRIEVRVFPFKVYQKVRHSRRGCTSVLYPSLPALPRLTPTTEICVIDLHLCKLEGGTLPTSGCHMIASAVNFY